MKNKKLSLNKKTKGSIAEMAVAANLLENGFRVLFPVDENCRYDIAAERDGKFLRIQVKYVTPKNGALEVNCRSSNNWSVLHYSVKDIDILAVYNPHNKSVYFISTKKINHSTFKLRLENPKNNQKIKINFAKNFQILEY